MLWLRKFDIDKEKLGNRFIIHGHTHKTFDFIKKQQRQRAVNIDGGCVFKDNFGFGNLIALNITEGKLMSIRNVD